MLGFLSLPFSLLPFSLSLTTPSSVPLPYLMSKKGHVPCDKDCVHVTDALLVLKGGVEEHLCILHAFAIDKRHREITRRQSDIRHHGRAMHSERHALGLSLLSR